MFPVICYDITDDKRRSKVVKIMESYGKGGRNVLGDML